MSKFLATLLFSITAILIIFIAFFVFFKIGKQTKPKTKTPDQKAVISQTEPQRIGAPPQFSLKLPQGYSIGVFSDKVSGARDLEFSPSGTLLVSTFSKGSVVALPDKNNDGTADEEKVILKGLDNPHGLAFYSNKLFVAEENKISKYSWDEATLTATFEKKLFDLPTGGRHNSRSIVFDSKGNLYLSLGSTCDTCVEKESFISTVLISDSAGKAPRIFSKGLRNAVFLTVKPNTNDIYVTEMGRDYLGDTTPPDEINILHDGSDFGWPYCYGNKVYDKVFKKQSVAYCANTVSPAFEIEAHSAPLGLTFINSPQFESENGKLLVAYHGSWNRSDKTGYKLVTIDFSNNPPKQADFITGFLENEKTLGRPVDIIFDNAGSLYISDDNNGSIYKVIKE